MKYQSAHPGRGVIFPAAGLLLALCAAGCSGTDDDDASSSSSPTPSGSQGTPTATATQPPGTGNPTPTQPGGGTPTQPGGGTPTQPATTELTCTSIQDLQDPSAEDHPAAGTRVKLCGVIVTGIRYDKLKLFVQEPEGGAYSGIYLFTPDDSTFIPSDVALGDELDIVGEYTVSFDAGQVALFSDELPASSITTLSRGNALPTPVDIADPSTIATLCDATTSGVDAAKYEGVRVKLSGVEITDLNPCEQGSFGVFEIADSLWVDDDFGMDFDPLAVGQDLESVTGVLHYAFDHFRVFPNPGEVVEDGSATPAPCTGEDITTLMDPDAGDKPAEGTAQTVCGAVVTATDTSGEFVIQMPEGAAFSGIYVFRGNYGGPRPVIGDIVDVTGLYAPFFGTLQLSLNDTQSAPNPTARIVVRSSGNDLPAPVEIADVATIATPASAACDPEDPTYDADGADARKYEAVRVHFGPVEITDLDPCGQGEHGVFEVEDSLFIDDDFGMDYTPAEGDVGTILSSVTGVLHRSFDAYRVFPGAGDVVEATGTRIVPGAMGPMSVAPAPLR